MDKFILAAELKKSKPINREDFILGKCNHKDVLDLGCIRHCADFSLSNPNWLHKKIKSVAKKVIGIDYLPIEIEKLKRKGYSVILGDVSKRLDIDDKFDVIVAGDLIEHLVNFEGFFENCRRLLKDDGILIITTANPFYSDEFNYLAWKKNFLVNPEHTCWIDPMCLEQLSERFGFIIDEIHYIKNPWMLNGIICESVKHRYDILNNKWSNETTGFKIARKIVLKIFNLFYSPYKFITGTNSIFVKYSDYLAVFKKDDK